MSFKSACQCWARIGANESGAKLVLPAQFPTNIPSDSDFADTCRGMLAQSASMRISMMLSLLHAPLKVY